MFAQVTKTGIPLPWVTGLLSGVYSLLILVHARAAFVGHWAFGIGGVVFWFSLTIGLWLRLRFCRVVALGVHFYLMLIIPFAILGKWVGFDSMPMKPQPPFWLMVSIVIAIGFLNCLVIFTLHKRKEEFGKQRHEL